MTLLANSDALRIEPGALVGNLKAPRELTKRSFRRKINAEL